MHFNVVINPEDDQHLIGSRHMNAWQVILDVNDLLLNPSWPSYSPHISPLPPVSDIKHSSQDCRRDYTRHPSQRHFSTQKSLLHLNIIDPDASSEAKREAYLSWATWWSTAASAASFSVFSIIAI
ncbi:hypothetical protein AC579_4832 [Pseudocercospora musae]|uniref:Uncharacterized protein n=1 Tax=Pseudocercospora musae TaxID=113226 RepID=A0A139IKG9_9PEZI|nr:hypothetical protein AC579_4832 [Pseudocercospora musae]